MTGCVPAGLRDGARNDLGGSGLPDCATPTTEPTPTPVPTPTATPTPTSLPEPEASPDTAEDGGSVASDRAALVAFYNATEGASWFTSTNWLSDRPIGEWYGVTTNSVGRVTSRLLKKSSRAVSALNRRIAAHAKPFVSKGIL